MAKRGASEHDEIIRVSSVDNSPPPTASTTHHHDPNNSHHPQGPHRASTPSSAFLASITALSPLNALDAAGASPDGGPVGARPSFDSFEMTNSLKALIPGVFSPTPPRITSPGSAWLEDLPSRPVSASNGHSGGGGDQIEQVARTWTRDPHSLRDEDALNKFCKLVACLFVMAL